MGIDFVVQEGLVVVGATAAGLVFEFGLVLEFLGGGVAFLPAWGVPETEVELLFPSGVLSARYRSQQHAGGHVIAHGGTYESLIHTEVVGVGAIAKVELPLAPLFPYVVDAVDIGQSATAIEPDLFDFALYGHFDVEGVGRSQFVPPNPGFEVVSAGFLVLGYGHGDGVEHVGGLYGGVAGSGAVCCGGLYEEVEVDRHHHFPPSFQGYAVVVAGSELCDAFDAIIGGFVGLKPLIEEGVKVGLCTLDDRISKVFDVGVTEFPLFHVVFHGLQEDRIAQVVLEVVEH